MEAAEFTQPLVTEESRPDEAVQPVPPVVTRVTKPQGILIALASIAFLYFAKPVVLPIVLACVGGMALKPLIRWLSYCHIRPALGAAVVLSLFAAALAIGFVKLGPPAMSWVNNAPTHMAELRHRVQKFFPPTGQFAEAAAAVNN